MTADANGTALPGSQEEILQDVLGEILDLFRLASMDIISFDRRQLRGVHARLELCDPTQRPFWADAMLEMISEALKGRAEQVRSRFVVLKGLVHEDWLVEFVSRYGLGLIHEVERHEIVPVINYLHAAVFHGVTGPHCEPITAITRELEQLKNTGTLEKNILFWAYAVLHLINRAIIENRRLQVEDLETAREQLPRVESLDNYLVGFIEKKQRLRIRPAINLLRAASYDISLVDEAMIGRLAEQMREALEENPDSHHVQHALVVLDMVAAAREGDIRGIIRAHGRSRSLPPMDWLSDCVEAFLPGLIQQADSRRLWVEGRQVTKLVAETKALLLMAGINPARVQPLFIRRIRTSFAALSRHQGPVGRIQELSFLILDLIEAVLHKNIPGVLANYTAFRVCLEQVRALPGEALPRSLMSNIRRFDEIADKLARPFRERLDGYTGLNALARIEQVCGEAAGRISSPVLVVYDPRRDPGELRALRDLASQAFTLFNLATVDVARVDPVGLKALGRAIGEMEARDDLDWARSIQRLVQGTLEGRPPGEHDLLTVFRFLYRGGNPALSALYKDYFVPWLYAQAARRRSPGA